MIPMSFKNKLKMARLISFIFIIGLPSIGFSQNPLVNIYGRNSRSLNGAWNYIVDPYETGFYSFHREAYNQQKEPSNYKT